MNNLERLKKLSPTEIEESILGAILIESDVILEISTILKPYHFSEFSYRTVFSGALDFFAKNGSIDVRSLSHYFRAKKNNEITPAFLCELTNSVASAHHIIQQAMIVIDCWQKREFLEKRIPRFFHELDENPSATTFLNGVVESVFDIQNELGESQTFSATETTAKAFDEIDVGKEKTNFCEYDKLITGFGKGEFHVIAARTSMGKTAFMLNLAHRLRSPSLIFSLESKATMLAKRMIKIGTGIDLNKKIPLNNQPHVYKKCLEFGDSQRWHICESRSLNLSNLKAILLRKKAKENIEVIFIDYLQLISEPSPTRELEISKISRGLQALALDLDITIVALAQLNRGVESRSEKRPFMSDIRESGAIEQSADVITLLYRPEYYELDFDANGESTENVCEVFVAKNREGATGKFKLHFDATKGIFSDFDHFSAQQGSRNIKTLD